eukprot:308572_1
MTLLAWFLLLLRTTELTNMIQHIESAELVDKDAISHDHCCIDFFYHDNETYMEDNDGIREKYEFTANDAYFFVSWSTLNVNGYSEIVGNVYNVQHPYLPLGNNDSFLPIISSKNPANYHYVSTSDFQSKPNDIVFSFYNENAIEIRVFGASKSNINNNKKDSFLWSPQIPIIRQNNNSEYNIIHQNIQCIDGNNTEFIIFVYEQKYMINNTQYTNIYKSTFNNKYIVSNDMNPINNIKGIISHPFVYQSLISNNIIITYVANHISIQYKLYSIDNNDELTQIIDEFILVSTTETKKQ